MWYTQRLFQKSSYCIVCVSKSCIFFLNKVSNWMIDIGWIIVLEKFQDFKLSWVIEMNKADLVFISCTQIMKHII